MADLDALYISVLGHQGREAGSMVERWGGGPRHTSSLHSFEAARCLSQGRERCAFDGFVPSWFPWVSKHRLFLF